jgi:hypothetical protein
MISNDDDKNTGEVVVLAYAACIALSVPEDKNTTKTLVRVVGTHRNLDMNVTTMLS